MNLVTKIDGSDLGHLGLMLREPVKKTNAGKMSISVVLTSESEDRDGDIVVTKGIRTAGHQKNPICVLDHKMSLGFGFCEDQLKNYTVKMRGNREMVGEIFCNQSSQLGLDTFRAAEARILRGVSIGFLPVVGKIEKRHERGTIYHESNLVEVTLTPVGANEDAIIEAVHKTFGKKPPCAELASILPKWEPREQVTLAEVADVPDFLIAKGGTYKMAEAKDAIAKTRHATYYECPHCGEEMTHEGIFREEDGTTRHGKCRGAVVLKSPEQLEPAKVTVGEQDCPKHPMADITASQTAGAVSMNKRARIDIRNRFLPGIRRKAMNGYHDDTQTDEDEFMPDDGGGYAADEGPDDGMGDGPGLKAGAEAHHGANDILMEAMQFIEDSKGSVDNATVMKTLDKVSKWIGKALAALHAGHSSYLKEHPDQPELPGAEDFGGEMGDDDSEEGDADDADDSDADDEWEEDDAEETGRKERKKALDAYWEYLKRKAVIGDGPVVRSAVDFLETLAANRYIGKDVRQAAKRQRTELEGLLTKGVIQESPPEATPAVLPGTEDEWEKALAAVGLEA